MLNFMDIIWSELPLTVYFVVFFVSLGVTSALVLTRKHHLGFTSRTNDQLAVQAAHRVPTPRVGGIGIALAIVVALVYGAGHGQGSFFIAFAVSIAPVFAIGLLEDLGMAMRPRYRLAAAAASSALVIALLGMYLPRLDLPFADVALTFAPLAIVFTVFAATGVCHSINLIDGLNGLSGTISIIIALGLAVIATFAGDITMSGIALCLVPALLGFLVFNFPRGSIFLGDAGAYAIGHVLAWLAIFIVWRNPDVSPWAILLVFFWPVSDTLFAMFRRRRAGKPTDQPDRLHFHQLVMRFIEIAFISKSRRNIANPAATLVIAPLAAIPATAGVILWSNAGLSVLMVLVFGGLFMVSYKLALDSARARLGIRRIKAYRATELALRGS
jgi:UDP-GlcNAc:undecaprenyl-phosphate GlcNAc-1-phosphate transferase